LRRPLFAIVMLLAVPMTALAHGGGLDACGCHGRGRDRSHYGAVALPARVGHPPVFYDFDEYDRLVTATTALDDRILAMVLLAGW
jgi:hypothetical protein